MSAAFTPEPDDRRDRDDTRSVPEQAPGEHVPEPAPMIPVPPTHAVSADPSGDGCLTERDKRILDGIAGHETGSDPQFAARLTRRSRPVSASTERLIQALAVAVVVAVLLPGEWRLTAVLIGLFLFGPAVVAWYGFRAGRGDGDGSGTPPAGPF